MNQLLQVHERSSINSLYFVVTQPDDLKFLKVNKIVGGYLLQIIEFQRNLFEFLMNVSLKGSFYHLLNLVVVELKHFQIFQEVERSFTN